MRSLGWLRGDNLSGCGAITWVVVGDNLHSFQMISWMVEGRSFK